MMKFIRLSARHELISSLASRYSSANRKAKQHILDQFITATGYHRKYAIALLNNPQQPASRSTILPPTRKRTYTTEVKDALVAVWKAANQICSKRLVPFLPEFLSALERLGHLTLSTELRSQLLQISPATVDRLLQDVRCSGCRSGRGTTRPGSLLKHQIPIRTFSDWDDLKPGFLEADLVAHCGSSVQGTYLNSLVLTDVATGWTEFFALLCRDQENVLRALRQAHPLLPFPLLGLDTDNGSEFLNELLFTYCRDEQITFTRCRPYKKNDQCHVEQKNGSLVRRFVGYNRFEGMAACRQLAALYGVLRLHVNFFQPSMKLISKQRRGSKVIKRYDQAQPPYNRVLASPDVTDEVKARLRAEYERLDPVELLRQVEHLQDLLWQHAYRPADWATQDRIASVPEDVDRGVEVVRLPQSRASENGPVKEENRTYRRTRKPTKHGQVQHTWRTRKDPFELVWEKVEARLEEEPSLEVKAIFRWLQQNYPGQFNDGQLRTLQRRVKAWRLARTSYCEGVLHPAIISTQSEALVLESL